MGLKEKNRAIEAFRFLFMLMICLWHYSNSHDILKHGYLGVEFFFILSGVFIYKALDKPNLNTPLEYFVKRWKRFNPKYVGAILITYLIIVFPNVVKGKADIKEILGVFPDFLMLQSVGIFNDMGGAE